MRKVLIFEVLVVIFCCLPVFLQGQSVTGQVFDERGETMPYTSIYVTNTSIGTTSNADGVYNLRLTPGKHNITFQFVGYATQQHEVELKDGHTERLDITLLPQSTQLAEAVVTADAEDPAYAIIRQAIKKRAYYLNSMPSYQCDVYVKGHQKLLHAPEKILGIEIGDLDGALDSTRSGIIYLSESVSTLYADGDQRKEVVKSSKISGDPQGYSFNSAREMEMNFYNNTIDLQRQIVSPIANNALSYYDYKLEGFFQDDYGHIVNKIAVLPKRDNDPVFYGYIYITDDLYNIHSLSLGVSPEATQIFFIDSLLFQQVHLPIGDMDQWALFNNTITFDAGLLGFEVEGEFTAVYSQYQLLESASDTLFDEYEYVILPSSNELDSAYWAEVRPVPLTEDEVIDYIEKDSIHEVRTDPVYMDSVDAESSRFDFSNLIGDYSYQRRSKGFYFDMSHPIGNLSFNTVQGFETSLKLNFRKYFDEEETRRLLWGAGVNYGFSEKRWRPNAYLVYRPTRLTNTQTRLDVGQLITQFNPEGPISAFSNGIYSLMFKQNYARYLDVKRARLAHRFEPANGLLLTVYGSWEERTQLSNHSDYSFFDKEDVYTSNADLGRGELYTFDQHQALILGANLRIRFGQKYQLRPHRRFDLGHQGPTFVLSYQGGFKALGGDVGFQKLALGIYDETMIGVGGRLRWYLNGGLFFNQENMNLRDYRHFNTSQIPIMSEQNYDRTFLLLPYYTHSTNERYFQAHAEHHFDGFILDKLPLFQKLSWHLVAGAKYLHVPDQPGYAEFHLGLDNIGYKLFRLFRVDGVMSLSAGEQKWGVRVSVGL